MKRIQTTVTGGVTTHTIYKDVPDRSDNECWEHENGYKTLANRFVFGRCWCAKHTPVDTRGVMVEIPGLAVAA